ncbi:bacillithiol biosynthesis cysteine-adding enzyme BshC [Spirosomataceae bacterium TFI 002]|nr:bacillithiol biosynthesis cysteine-adding enzyme BshC [Spirosomataceae bacterium TFI 002]
MKPNCTQIPLSSTGAFPKLLLDYLQKETSLEKFYNVYPDIAGFKQVIENRKFTSEKREVLVSELSKQYEGIENPPFIEQLKDEKTFTITTGHQLNIFTGPLYIVYKIVTVINLCKALKEAYPSYNFVPVYWMATEDHDLEEIQSFRLFEEKHTWNTDQKGAVGRMKTDGLAEMASKFGKKATIFKEAYSSSKTLGDAVRKYMHELFGSYGLVTIDADTRAFKSLFTSVIKDDLINHNAFIKAEENTKSIAGLGYKTTIQAREINFFYLEEGSRERIEKDESGYKIVDTDKRFSKEELFQLVDNEPEKFSPNVVLRPLYEEVILPNLAYIGGPSEVPYWLQLKGVFDHFDVDFPALIPRNFALVLSNRNQEFQQKIGLSDKELFLTEHEQQQLWVRNNSQKPIVLSDEKEKIASIFEDLKSLSTSIDVTLGSTSDAFETKTLNLIDSLEKKILRAEKKNHGEKMGQISKLKANLFPGGGLQERKDNLIEFLSENPDFIVDLVERFAPLSYKFNILRD